MIERTTKEKRNAGVGDIAIMTFSLKKDLAS